MEHKREQHIRFGWLSMGILLLLVAMILTPYPLQAQLVSEKIADNGDDANRMVWVIMGDGYTSMEMDNYEEDVVRVIDEFFGTSPWSDYKSFVNIYRIDLVSNESGADHPSSNLYVDTALDATYDTYGITRLLTVDDFKALEIASATVPSFDAVMIIVNDESYGGSGGATMVLSNHEKAGRIALHEAGHLVGGLADEYETPYPGYPEGDGEPNVTYQKAIDYIPWKNWIDTQTPLPTPEYEGDFPVGLYEGARYKSTGIYRPTQNSIMRSLGAPYGPVNAESLIINLYDYVDPIDHYAPDKSNVFLSSNSNMMQFMIELVPGSDEHTQVSWKIDGEKQEGHDHTYLNLDVSTLKMGTHSIVVRVQENSSWVRNDPQGLLVSTHEWSLEKGLASGVLSGMVTDSITHLGIEGAWVASEDGNYSAQTAADGSFKISPVAEGLYAITANADRYNANRQSLISINDGDTTTVALPLEPLFDTYSLSGNIMGDGEEGLTVYLNKDGEAFMSVHSTVNGHFMFNGLENGSYTLTPVSSDYVFIPPYYECTVDDQDLKELDFKAFAIFCPAQAILQESASLNLLREFREHRMARNETGRMYINLYYRHGAELIGLILSNQDVQDDMSNILRQIIPVIRMTLQGKTIVLDDEWMESIDNHMNRLESGASSGLKRTLKMIREDMRDKDKLKPFGLILP